MLKRTIYSFILFTQLLSGQIDPKSVAARGFSDLLVCTLTSCYIPQALCCKILTFAPNRSCFLKMVPLELIGTSEEKWCHLKWYFDQIITP